MKFKWKETFFNYETINYNYFYEKNISYDESKHLQVINNNHS